MEAGKFTATLWYNHHTCNFALVNSLETSYLGFAPVCQSLTYAALRGVPHLGNLNPKLTFRNPFNWKFLPSTWEQRANSTKGSCLMKQEGRLLVEANVESTFFNYKCLTRSSAWDRATNQSRHTVIARLQRMMASAPGAQGFFLNLKKSPKSTGVTIFSFLINIPHTFFVLIKWNTILK